MSGDPAAKNPIEYLRPLNYSCVYCRTVGSLIHIYPSTSTQRPL
jgi:hypothetical protein